MTTRQTVLDILEEHNQNIKVARLLDLIDSEKEWFYTLGEKSGRHGALADKRLAFLNRSYPAPVHSKPA